MGQVPASHVNDSKPLAGSRRRDACIVRPGTMASVIPFQCNHSLFSAVSGLTYNFKNQNGIDWHVDLEASRFLSEQFYVGAVGYSFNQLTGDTGSAATLGPYTSRQAHEATKARRR
jgi:Putative MetA-pathway of phenol degradation